MNVRPSPRRCDSVLDDWHAWLPDAKDRSYRGRVQDLESSYIMLSVALNDAIELRDAGWLAKAFDAAKVANGLCLRFTHSLAAVLGGLSGHAKHYGTVPNTVPLDPSNFRGPHEQRTARLSGLLNRILLSQRSQFIHKATALHEMVLDLEREFRDAVEELSSGAYLDAEPFWSVLDQGHFDLNTCLRETYVLLKSFMVVLPEDQLASFEASLAPQTRLRSKPSPALRHRRFAAVPGK